MAESADDTRASPEGQVDHTLENASGIPRAKPDLPKNSENQPQGGQNMETHAQHLHKAPGQGWKHYFFEFLMLFQRKLI
jgi:hypothetical protein